MDQNKLALEITRLKMRAYIQEILLLQLRLLLPVATAGVSVDESRRATQDNLEAIASELEQHMFSTDDFGPMNDAERALYADEIREVVDKMKSLVDPLADYMKKQHDKHGKKT